MSEFDTSRWPGWKGRKEGANLILMIAQLVLPSFCLFTLLLLLLSWDQGIPGDNCPIIAVNTRYIVHYKLFLNPWFLSLGFQRHKSRYRRDSVKNGNLESFSLIMLYGNINQLGAKLKAISLILLIFLRLFTTSFI